MPLGGGQFTHFRHLINPNPAIKDIPRGVFIKPSSNVWKASNRWLEHSTRERKMHTLAKYKGRTKRWCIARRVVSRLPASCRMKPDCGKRFLQFPTGGPSLESNMCQLIVTVAFNVYVIVKCALFNSTLVGIVNMKPIYGKTVVSRHHDFNNLHPLIPSLPLR